MDERVMQFRVGVTVLAAVKREPHGRGAGRKRPWPPGGCKFVRFSGELSSMRINTHRLA